MSEALLAEAIGCHRAGDLAEAERRYRRVLQSQPKHGMALHLLSSLMVEKGDLAEGLRLARRASSLYPDGSEHWSHQASVLIRLGREAEALPCLERAVSLRPDAVDAWVNRGSVLGALGRHEEALKSFDHALALQPGAPVPLANRGLALLELRRPDLALETFEQAIALRPGDAQAHNNRGLALQALDRHDEAVAAFDRAVALQPGFADALNHRGVSLQALGDAEAALASYQAAVARRPGDPWFHWNAGLCRLLMGDYAGGWPEYEWRLQAMPMPRFDRPLWQGEALRGRTLLLHTEQGLGDIIQFCRYAPLVPGAGRVILQAPAPLVDLLRSLPPPVEVVAAGARPPRFDLHCPLLSLPARFGSTLETLPCGVPYLSVPAGPAGPPPGEGRTIGICWQGNPAVRIDPERSVPLARFAPLAAVPGVRLLSLQKGHGLEQLAAFRNGVAPGIVTLGPDGPADFMATARAVQACDLVITSDTVIAHLAGALARPVWLATSFVPDWRWGRSGETCAWYPTMRLFRQPRRGDWDAVFSAMAAALA